MNKAAFFVLVQLGISSIAHAGAVQYRCEFKTFASPEGISPADGFLLEFNYDSVTQNAFIMGNNGVSPVHVISGYSGVTFLEPLHTGAVQNTTIAEDGSAVHSRHTLIGRHITPSQYYGTCSVF